MNKFAQMLSADSTTTLSKRAEILAENTVGEVENFIGNLKSEKRNLTSNLLDLTDLSPENTYDLRPGGKAFDAKKWVQSVHKLRMDIALKDVEIAEAQGIYDEWFVEQPEAKVKK